MNNAIPAAVIIRFINFSSTLDAACRMYQKGKKGCSQSGQEAVTITDFLDSAFAAELHKLVIHSSPLYAVFTYSAKYCPKYTSFKNS